MDSIFSRLILSLSLVTFLVVSTADARSREPDLDPSHHICVGCREVTDDEMEAIESQRHWALARIALADQEFLDTDYTPTDEIGSSELGDSDASDGEDEHLLYHMPGQEHAVRSLKGLPHNPASLFFAESYPYSTHHPVHYSPGGETVELENGSIWRVDDRDAALVRNWIRTDELLIAPNYTWWSTYPFRLVNVGTKSSVQVKLKMGPFEQSKHNRWITSIDYAAQELWLDDGSRWSMSGLDSAISKKWLVDDNIIIGTNDDWLSYSMPNILINVTTYIPSKANLSYVRAVHIP